MKSILSRRSQLALALTLFLGLPGASYGAAITVPQGLNPGDTYRIIFATSTRRDVTSSNIADYNAFVTNAANLDAGLAGLATTWTALASTATVNALVNSGLSPLDITTRFYNTQGALIATGVLGLYGGFVHSAVIFDEAGNTALGGVATGTTSSGSSGDNVLGGTNNFVTIGNANHVDDYWTYAANSLMSNQSTGEQYLQRLYGVSGVLTVPTPGAPVATPEPSTIALVGGAFVALAVAKAGGARK